MRSVRWFESSWGRLNRRCHHRCDDAQMRDVVDDLGPQKVEGEWEKRIDYAPSVSYQT